MKRKYWIRILPAMALLAFACPPAGGEAAFDEDAVAREVKAASEAADQALVAGDVDGYLAHYLDEAVWLPPNAEEIVGKSAARARLEGMIGAVNIEGGSKIEEQVVMDKDWVGERGQFNIVMTPKEGDGKPAHQVGSYVSIWKRDADGTWKIALDIWNSDRGLPPMARAPGQQ